MKRSAGLVSSLALPSFLAGGARAAPADRIGIAYIGCGRRSAQLHGLPPEGEIVAAADCYLPRAEAVVKDANDSKAAKDSKDGQAPKARAFQDYRRLLDLREVDAVIIASPDHWHILHAVHAVLAGKDVYVEKPLSLTIREGRLLARAARKHGRIVQCGSQQRSTRENQIACELIRSGRIGKVLEVVGANYASPWECRLPGKDPPAGLDWDAWCGPTEPVPFHEDIFTPRANPGWISFRPWSGGEMTGWGAHGLDQVQWALGMDASGPVEVWTEGGAFEPPTYTESGTREKGEAICSKPTVFYRYASGTVLRLGDGPPGGAIFRGEKGTITIDRGRFTASPEVGKVDPPAPKPRRGAGIDEHIADWFDSMKSRKLPAADIELAHRSTTVCHLGNLARWTCRRLKWDPEREIFPDDAAANALLDRSRRKGFEMPEVS